MKQLLTALIIGALAFGVGTATAFNPDGGDAGQGKEDFKKCRACHDGNKAKTLSPSGKTKKQWGRYFKDDFKKLKKKMPDFDTYGISAAQLENIHRYLSDHALDSDKPQTCD